MRALTKAANLARNLGELTAHWLVVPSEQHNLITSGSAPLQRIQIPHSTLIVCETPLQVAPNTPPQFEFPMHGLRAMATVAGAGAPASPDRVARCLAHAHRAVGADFRTAATHTDLPSPSAAQLRCGRARQQRLTDNICRSSIATNTSCVQRSGDHNRSVHTSTGYSSSKCLPLSAGCGCHCARCEERRKQRGGSRRRCNRVMNTNERTLNLPSAHWSEVQ